MYLCSVEHQKTKSPFFLNLEETSFPCNKLVALETTGTK